MIGRGVTGEAVGWKGSLDVSLWGLRMGIKTGASLTSSSRAILGRLGMNLLVFSSSRKGKLSCVAIFVVAGKFGNGEGPGGAGV